MISIVITKEWFTTHVVADFVADADWQRRLNKRGVPHDDSTKSWRGDPTNKFGYEPWDLAYQRYVTLEIDRAAFLEELGVKEVRS